MSPVPHPTISIECMPARSPQLRRMLLPAFAVALGIGCSSKPVPRKGSPAPYVAPPVGTVYTYTNGIVNQVLAVQGWHTAIATSAGSVTARLALFIPEYKAPLSVASDADLQRLWPLKVGSAFQFDVTTEQVKYNWEFTVRSVETVIVPAGEFETYVVQAVQTPKLVHDPKNAVSATFTWYYAPKVNAVVRFQTRYLTGPSAGRVFNGDLVSIKMAPVAATDSTASVKK